MDPSTWSPVVWTLIAIGALGALFALIPVLAKSFGSALVGEEPVPAAPPRGEDADRDEDEILRRILDARNARDLMAILNDYDRFDEVEARELVMKAVELKNGLTAEDWGAIYDAVPTDTEAERIATQMEKDALSLGE